MGWNHQLDIAYEYSLVPYLHLLISIYPWNSSKDRLHLQGMMQQILAIEVTVPNVNGNVKEQLGSKWAMKQTLVG